MRRLREKDNLIPQPNRREGHGPAKYYWLERTGALVGFVGALTNVDFAKAVTKSGSPATVNCVRVWEIIWKLI